MLSEDILVIKSSVWSLEFSSWNLLTRPAAWHGVIQRLVTVNRCDFGDILGFLLSEDTLIIKSGIWSLELSSWLQLTAPASRDGVVKWLISVDRGNLWNVRLLSEDILVIETSVRSLKLSSRDLLTAPATWHSVIERLIPVNRSHLRNVV